MAKKGQSFNSYNPELKKLILDRYFSNQGTQNSLAKEFGVPRGTIKTWILKNNNGLNVCADKRGRPKKIKNKTIKKCMRY